MTEQLVEIGGRLKGLRSLMDITLEQMAKDMNIDKDEYLAYEQGQRDFSFSFLFNVANRLGVDILDIISGDTPKLMTCALVRKGEGYVIERRDAYEYKHLAFTFNNKKAEPFLVSVEPQESEVVLPHSHDGQEFNYVISGSLEFSIDGMTYTLNEGDSVYFDSNIIHSIRAIGNETSSFIAVVVK
ncbi:MAG: XRE family transcriptional regulator [Oscillospiraceae bacterium]|nr:XRE family transcriptional regulator [Oscillospiraceae bacterium]